MNKKDRLLVKYLGILCILVLGIGAYSNTFHSTFQFDDLAFIIKNYAIRNLWDLKAISQAVLSQPSRVVGLYTFAVNYYFHQLNVEGYHATNLAIHLINTFLVWWLVVLLLKAESLRRKKQSLGPKRKEGRSKLKKSTKKFRQKDETFTEGQELLIPLIAAILFVIHPVQTQAVTYISQRFASLATLFYLASVGFYIQARLSFSGSFSGASVARKGDPEKAFEETEGNFPEKRRRKDRRNKDRRKLKDRRKSQQIFHGEEKRQYLERRKLNDRRAHTNRRRKEEQKKWELSDKLKEKELQKQKRLEKKERKLAAKRQRKESHLQGPVVLSGKSKKAGNKKSKRDRRGWRVLFFGLSLLCAILGMFTKEIVITLPLMILMVEGFFFFNPKKDRKFFVGLSICLLLLLFIIPALFKFKFFGLLFAPRASESHQGDWLTLPTYLLTQLRVFATFLRLLIFPVGQNFDYDFPMSHSLFEPTTFISLCVLTGLFALGVFLFRRHRLYAFGIFWFFVTLSANLIPRVHVIFEHKLYLVSLGFCLCVSLFCVERVRNSKILFAFLCGIILTFSVLTYQRNKVWENGITLWEDVVKKSPNKIRAHHNLGTYYRQAGRFNDALQQYDAALALEPNYAISHNQKAGVLREQGKYQDALAEYNKALSIDPELSRLYNNRGNVYKSLKQYPQALANYNQAIEKDPNYATAYYNRAIIFEKARQFDLALADYSRVLQIDPEFAQAFNNRGRMLCQRKQFDPALKDFQEALRFDPDLIEAYFNLARTYEALKQYDAAIDYYEKAIALKPDYLSAYFNLGNIYAQTGRYSQAIDYYRRLLDLNPYHKSARINLQKVIEILSKIDQN